MPHRHQLFWDEMKKLPYSDRDVCWSLAYLIYENKVDGYVDIDSAEELLTTAIDEDMIDWLTQEDCLKAILLLYWFSNRNYLAHPMTIAEHYHHENHLIRETVDALVLDLVYQYTWQQCRLGPTTSFYRNLKTWLDKDQEMDLNFYSKEDTGKEEDNAKES